MVTKDIQVLDGFMEMMLKSRRRVNVFLKSGLRLNGYILNYDTECIALHDRPEGEASTIIARNFVASVAKDNLSLADSRQDL